MLDSSGAVAECTGANIFLVQDDVLVTPTTRAALPGITRRTIIELARERGIEVHEREVWPTELYTADGVFVTGSGAGIVAVAAVDGHQVATTENNVAKTLAAGYRERTRDPRYAVAVDATLSPR
jgi:branched-chain amino acid aminotransferase